MQAHRVVVTGMGCLAPNGNTLVEFWDALLAGTSGIRPIQSFDVSEYSRKLGGEVQGFDAEERLGAEVARRCGRSSQLAIAAAREALAHAGLSSLERGSLLAVGTTMGDVSAFEAMNEQWLDGGTTAMNAALAQQHAPAGFTARVSRGLGHVGPGVGFANACAAGNTALGYAFEQVRRGEVPLAVAGGADGLSRIIFTGFARLGAMAPEHCQPFDKNRKGMLVAEGAAMLVLERMEDAQRRGARIWAEISGYGLTSDAHHITSPHPEGRGLARAMRRALQVAEVAAEQVDYVGAHGTGTPSNDVIETKAIYDTLGARAERVPTSSIKSMTGHTMGAASALQTVATAMAIAHDKAPPTMNFVTPDPACPVDCVPNAARDVRIRVAICNSAGFGGINACLVLKKATHDE